MAALGFVGFLLLVAAADSKEPRKAKRHKPNINYILRRQEAYQVRGVPVRSILTHGRRIDIYRDGSAFEGDNRVN